MKKLLKGILIFVLCLSAALCGTQTQAKTKPKYKGKWENTEGKNTIKWRYDSRTKRLTISGKGKMENGHPNDEVEPSEPGWKRFSDSIKELVIREGVTNAGVEMLYRAENLKSIKLANSVRKIGACAFGSPGPKKLKKIDLPPFLGKIGDFAFDSSGLTEVTIPSSVKVIGYYAFMECDDLQKVIIRPGLKKLKMGAFWLCSGLKEVVLSEGLEIIGRRCFSGCVALKEISLPKTVQEIKDEAFDSCSLRRVIIKSEKITHWGKDIFRQASKNLVIEVPKRKLKEYRKQLYDKGLPKYVKVVAHKG